MYLNHGTGFTVHEYPLGIECTAKQNYHYWGIYVVTLTNDRDLPPSAT